MNTWLQLAIALVSLAAAGVSAYQQVRKRYRPPAALASHGATEPRRPVLNGFSEILREALDKIYELRQENQQLKIRIAELEAAQATKPRARTRRPTAVRG